MNNFYQDVRHALRSMRKSPAFTTVAVLTLALGIGANTAIFTFINAIFFNPLPIHAPERVVALFTTDQRNRGGLNNFLPISYLNGMDIQKEANSFSGVALYGGTGVSMTVDGEAESLTAQIVSGNFFDLLGVPAVLGRTFRADEDGAPGSGPVIVLNYGLWQRKFASDPHVIGKSILLNAQSFTIIGVAPRGFQGATVIGGPDMWVPMSMHDQVLSGLQKAYFNERRFLGFFAVARLKPGISAEQARGELHALGSNLESEFPLPNKDRNFTLLSLIESTINPNVRQLFTHAGALMMTVVGFVLLIACANIANLLLVRAAGRKREISIRMAVGASRSRIIVQLLTESLVLSTIGGLLGLGLAIVARNLLWQFRPPFLLQSNLDISLNPIVLMFTACITLGTGVIFGLAPALQASRPDLVSELKERAGGEMFSGRRFGLRNAFTVLQVALCLVALIGAGLFLMSLRTAQQMDLGFDTRNLEMVSFNVGSLNYDPARTREFQRRVLETAAAVPGVKAATLAAAIPLFGGGFGRSVFPEGAEGSSDRNGVLVNIDGVAPDYLRTMGIPLVRGEDFSSSLREEDPKIAIINETAAHRFWRDQDPIGKRFKFFGTTEWIQVIGVSHDSKYFTLGEGPTPYIYLPLIQNPASATTLFFRTNASPSVTLNSVRNQLQALDRNLPLTNVWPIGQVISQSLWGARFGAGLLTIFAAIAVLLCAVGIYGVVSYSVGQRAREIGIRLALGAQSGDVLLMVLRQSALMIAAGLMLGLVSSFVLARLITNLLFGVNSNAPAAFGIMALILTLIGLVASYVPARHAAAVDPIIAMRNG